MFSGSKSFDVVRKILIIVSTGIYLCSIFRVLNTSTHVKAVTKLFLLSNDTSESKFHLTLTTISEGRELISSETRGCLILNQKESRRTIHALCAMFTRGIFRCERKHHSKHFSQVFDNRTDDTFRQLQEDFRTRHRCEVPPKAIVWAWKIICEKKMCFPTKTLDVITYGWHIFAFWMFYRIFS